MVAQIRAIITTTSGMSGAARDGGVLVQFTVSLRRVHEWFDGAIAPVIDIARRVEAAGIDQVGVVDHILMGEDASGYPYGKFEFPLSYHWWEPVTLLGALASATSRIRLTTSVIVSPLRPAVLLAKQMTTLDHIAGGRVDLGVGVGWQKAEYDAAGIPWQNRFAQMEDQIRACKQLWCEAPATYRGAHVSFSRIHQRPFPLQPGGIPIWLGVGDSERSLARIAELADGWCPPFNDLSRIASALDRLAPLMSARGRDTSQLKTRIVLPTEKSASGPDLDASLAHVRKIAGLGVTMIEIAPAVFCKTADSLDDFLAAVNASR